MLPYNKMCIIYLKNDFFTEVADYYDAGKPYRQEDLF